MKTILSLAVLCGLAAAASSRRLLQSGYQYPQFPSIPRPGGWENTESPLVFHGNSPHHPGVTNVVSPKVPKSNPVYVTPAPTPPTRWLPGATPVPPVAPIVTVPVVVTPAPVRPPPPTPAPVPPTPPAPVRITPAPV